MPRNCEQRSEIDRSPLAQFRGNIYLFSTDYVFILVEIYLIANAILYFFLKFLQAL